jgi:hypothetical protein
MMAASTKAILAAARDPKGVPRQPGDHLQQRRLSAARRPDNDEKLSLVDGKTNTGHESYREISSSHCVIPTPRSRMPPLGKPLPLKACVVSLPEYAANNAFLLRKRHSAGQHPRPAGA